MKSIANACHALQVAQKTLSQGLTTLDREQSQELACVLGIARHALRHFEAGGNPDLQSLGLDDVENPLDRAITAVSFAVVELRDAPGNPTVGAAVFMIDGVFCALESAREEDALMPFATFAICE